MSEVYIAHIGTGTLIHVDEAVLVDLKDWDDTDSDEPDREDLICGVVAGTPLRTVISKTFPGLALD